MKRSLAALAAAGCLIAIAACGAGQPRSAHPQNPHLGDIKGLPAPLRLTAEPSVLMYDAVTVGNIPASARAAACYASGPYANCGAMRARLPHAAIVSIATYAGAAARCLDTEPGDAVPSQDAGWVRAMLARGVYHPCIYASLSEMSEVKADLARAGIPRSDYMLWDTHWTGVFGIEGGYDATQYFSDCCIDKDAVSLAFLATRPAPPPPPADPHHYLISPSRKLPGGMRGGPFSSPYDKLDERLVREQYQGARGKARYAVYLTHLQAELRWLANRVAFLAIREHHGWGPDHLGSRFQILIHDSQGKAD